MIHNPMVSGGSSGGAWKEVTREEVAELAKSGSWPFNVLVAVFTPDFPNQPMILPFSNAFGIGNSYSGQMSECSYAMGIPEEGVEKIIYAFTVGASGGFSTNPGDAPYFTLNFHDETGASDVIPEGWEIKYFVYEG